MKLQIIIIFLFTRFIAFGQVNEYTKQKQFDSAKIEALKLKERDRLNEFNSFLSKSLKTIDTVFSSSDSTRVVFLGNNNEIIREIITTKRKWSPFTSDSLVKADSIVMFYNKNGQLAYLESWDFSWMVVFDSPEQGMIQFPGQHEPQLTLKYRIEYDRNGCETLFVFMYHDLITRERKGYDIKGNLVSSEKDYISLIEFWE